MPVTTTTISAQRNRIQEHMEKEAKTDILFALRNPLAASHDKAGKVAKLQHYRQLYRHYSHMPINQEEKDTLRFLSREINLLRTSLTPGITARIRRHPVTTWLRDLIKGDLPLVRTHLAHENELKQEWVQQYNVQELSKALRDQGFTRNVETVLNDRISLGGDEFEFRYYDLKQKDTDFVIHCSKIPGTERYYFDRFEAISIPPPEQLAQGRAESIRQNFTIGDQLNATASQANALVNKRPVCNGNNQWWYLDFTKLGTSFPFSSKLFDALKAIEELPFTIHNNVKEMIQLAAQLQRGELATIPVQQGDQIGKYKLQADVLNDTLQVFNNKGDPVNKYELSETAHKQKVEQVRAINNRKTTLKKSKTAASSPVAAEEKEVVFQEKPMFGKRH